MQKSNIIVTNGAVPFLAKPRINEFKMCKLIHKQWYIKSVYK